MNCIYGIRRELPEKTVLSKDSMKELEFLEVSLKKTNQKKQRDKKVPSNN